MVTSINHVVPHYAVPLNLQLLPPPFHPLGPNIIPPTSYSVKTKKKLAERRPERHITSPGYKENGGVVQKTEKNGGVI